MSDCVLWEGKPNSHGYGRDHHQYAHRVAYIKAYGEIADGLHIHHRCENRMCVNPEHLVALTQAEHYAEHGDERMLSAAWAARRAVTHCPQGHPYDEENTIHKGNERRCRSCERQHSRESYWRHVDKRRARMRERARERYAEQKAQRA